MYDGESEIDEEEFQENQEIEEMEQQAELTMAESSRPQITLIKPSVMVDLDESSEVDDGISLEWSSNGELF